MLTSPLTAAGRLSGHSSLGSSFPLSWSTSSTGSCLSSSWPPSYATPKSAWSLRETRAASFGPSDRRSSLPWLSHWCLAWGGGWGYWRRAHEWSESQLGSKSSSLCSSEHKASWCWYSMASAVRRPGRCGSSGSILSLAGTRRRKVLELVGRAPSGGRGFLGLVLQPIQLPTA